MSEADPPIVWRKSTFSPDTNCVELAEFPDGTIAIRNSNDPTAATLHFPRAAIAALIKSAKSGHLDDMC